MDITLFEIHLPEAQFNAPFSSGSPAEDEDVSVESATAGDGPNLVPIAMLAVFLGLAALARHFRKPKQAELDEFDDD
jgi:hypothetical protein